MTLKKLLDINTLSARGLSRSFIVGVLEVCTEREYLFATEQHGRLLYEDEEYKSMFEHQITRG